MKKTVLALAMGILLIGVNVYAEGDLIVNGKLGIGTDTPNAKLDVRGSAVFNEDGGDYDFRIEGDTESNLFFVDAGNDRIGFGTNTPAWPVNFIGENDGVFMQVENPVTTSGFKLGLRVVTSASGAGYNPSLNASDYVVTWDGTGSTGGSIRSFQNRISYRGEGRLASITAATNSLAFNTAAAGTTYVIDKVILNAVSLGTAGENTKDGTVTDYYGFYGTGGAAGSGSLSGTNWRHAYFEDFPDYGGTIANTAGLWIDKMTRGSTFNASIVLDGDGVGADIVFGPNQEARIFSSSGELYTEDGLGNVTQISPHDPETGEWIFYSKNIKTGKVVRVDMEKLVRAVEKLTGEKFMVETLEETNY